MKKIDINLKVRVEIRKEKMIMNYGLTLSSPNGLEDLSAKYSILYWIFGGGGAVIGLISVSSFEAY